MPMRALTPQTEASYEEEGRTWGLLRETGVIHQVPDLLKEQNILLFCAWKVFII